MYENSIQFVTHFTIQIWLQFCSFLTLLKCRTLWGHLADHWLTVHFTIGKLFVGIRAESLAWGAIKRNSEIHDCQKYLGNSISSKLSRYQNVSYFGRCFWCTVVLRSCCARWCNCLFHHFSIKHPCAQRQNVHYDPWLDWRCNVIANIASYRSVIRSVVSVN